MTTSIDQVARLLSEIPYIEAHPGIRVTEVARVFGISPAQVRKDVSVAIFCGLPGGYPSDLIDVDLDVLDDEGVLYLTNPTTLDRPLRLTIPEMASLHLALTVLRSLVPDDVVASIDALMAKVSLPSQPDIDLRLAAGDEAVRRMITGAIAAGDQVQLTYEGRSRGHTTHPVVDPASVYVADSVAYLAAYDIAVSAWRTYRLDRVARVEVTGQPSAPHPRQPGPQEWAQSLATSATVTLTVDQSAAWIGEYYPTRAVRPCGDEVVVELPVVDPVWLVRLLLSLGGQVSRVEPGEYARAARDVAADTLALYS
ncbi:MAG: WYL domain-containing protein [Propionibacteriaceae bacterium]|jgi:proteasome accessory factor C|nr:WYL domain-containing protein [Propionibacteriaceae bacterium]